MLCTDDWLDHRQQGRLGADFQENVDTLFVQGGDAIGKADGLAHMAHPVIGALQLSTGQLTGEVGDDPHRRRVIGNGCGHRAEGIKHRLHQP